MLWALVGQTLVTALTTLKQNTTFTLSPSVAVSPGEIIVTSSLNAILDAMNSVHEACPLIGASSIFAAGCVLGALMHLYTADEAAKLQNMVTQASAGLQH